MSNNKEMLGRVSKYRESNGRGRPRIDRDLILRNMKLKDNFGNPKYKNKQLASMAGCDVKTIQRIRKEFIESGDLNDEETNANAVGIVEADFDAESLRVKPYSFSSWLETRFKKKSQAVTHYNFTVLVWEKVWDKCSLVEMADRNSNLADSNAIKFIQFFGDDKERIRSRIKQINFLFRYLGRQDVKETHLRLDNSKHPRAIRNVPELTNLDFPEKWELIENDIMKDLGVQGHEARLILRFKIATQMRTGEKADQRECWGLTKGSDTRSYLYFNSPETYQCHVYAKKGEEWDIIWLPREVREPLYEHWERVEYGETLWGISNTKLLNRLRKYSKKHLGRELILHDMRKISLTWMYVMGVPLEVATMINVGWKDLDTARDHYLTIKNVLRKSYRKEYRQKIPEWFKDGLEDFTGFEATIPGKRLRKRNEV